MLCRAAITMGGLYLWWCFYIHECRYISICYVGLRLLWGDSICGGVVIYMCRYISICYVGMQLVWGDSICGGVTIHV